mmetsp:Transcript_17852/g.49918  ORF Transcript_17852/g.49918 Transcript_17852/m.49918 type:complete len:143 (-) Transcript_17852:1156-1584(-)|eukprot:284129-Pelagomonas_calceolata.AAC.12
MWYFAHTVSLALGGRTKLLQAMEAGVEARQVPSAGKEQIKIVSQVFQEQKAAPVQCISWEPAARALKESLPCWPPSWPNRLSGRKHRVHTFLPGEHLSRLSGKKCAYVSIFLPGEHLSLSLAQRPKESSHAVLEQLAHRTTP